MTQTLSAFSRLSWYPFSERPVIASKWYMPALGDPFFLFPEESPDGKWHLFGHSWIGLEHFISENGISWEPRKMVCFRGRSPSLFEEDGRWYLLYEKHDPDLPVFGKKRRAKREKKISRSRFEMAASDDLLTFEEPVVILDSAEIPLAADGLAHPRVSRPQIIKVGEVYRLYYGISHRMMIDTAQKGSRHFGMATSTTLLGPYVPYNGGEPLLSADADDRWRSMAVGSIRVIAIEDGFVGLQCAYGWDAEKGKSVSHLIQLESVDGIEWKTVARRPLLSSPAQGWASSYIVSCDVNYKASEACWYCYYSANRRINRILAPESIGLLLGKEPALRRLTV
ncbi:MAG: hypothetical protein WC233_10085 [Sphaerochaeta sp.]|jgi:hypothetical protein|nr:hypothetical protein [Spirochaetales bacterium]